MLTHIFNLSLMTGVFPNRMQIAKVSVLHETGIVNVMGNYRPISILPVFSKALERVLHTRISIFSTKHNLI